MINDIIDTEELIDAETRKEIEDSIKDIPEDIRAEIERDSREVEEYLRQNGNMFDEGLDYDKN